MDSSPPGIHAGKAESDPDDRKTMGKQGTKAWKPDGKISLALQKWMQYTITSGWMQYTGYVAGNS
jgi:hypothetical protein